MRDFEVSPLGGTGAIDTSRVPLVKPDLPTLDELAVPFNEALTTGRVSNFGPQVGRFEEETGRYLGAGTVAVSSGTMGLLFSLQALGIGHGDQVAVPSFTFTASAQAVIYAGASPVMVDIKEDLTISPDDLARVLADYPAVRAVLPVHTFGLPVDVTAVEEVVQSAGRPVHVVYDAAHAFGSAIGDRRVGTFGRAEVFSLSATKVLVSIEGGLIASNDEQLLERIRKMRNYGIEAKYDAWYPGLNGKMSEFHAAVGNHNLARIEELMEMRRLAAGYYREQMEAVSTVALLPWPEGVTHTFKDFGVILNEVWVGRQSDLQERLSAGGIETRRYFYPPLHQQRYLKPYVDRSLPKTTRLAERVLCLPFFSTIGKEQIERVVEALAEAEGALL